MSITELRAVHADALTRFFRELPDGDITFIKEDVTDPARVRSWADAAGGATRWVALDGDRVTGYVAMVRQAGWSDHVGEVRLVVHPDSRGTGLGGQLARYAFSQALEAGLSKLVVELVADQEHALEMFLKLGFTGEALLRDHIRDRDGGLRDLVVLAHHVDTNWSAMTAVGLADELGG
ncbi:MAG TPA: GNAT family N-acetyltransferase [Pseudonocardia sp.]|nr:GNAT family N-acetyltransferase [Pseudonocardia sp.]